MKFEQERRKYNRVKINTINADYRVIDPTLWSEYQAKGKKVLQDISLEGASFKADFFLPENSYVCLKLSSGKELKSSDICGRVVRIKELEKNRQFEIGVNFFWWVNEEDKIGLVKFLESKS